MRGIFMSGPIPVCGHGVGWFSRLLSLHTWLSSACAPHNIFFIADFNLLWELNWLFKYDGMHHNGLGTEVLSLDISHGAIESDPSVSAG